MEREIAICRLCFLLFFFVFMVYGGWRFRPEKAVIRTFDAVCMYAKESKHWFWDYGRLNHFLISNGADYHLGKWINPLSYIGSCFVLCGLGIWIGLNRGILVGIFLGMICGFFPGMYIEYSNRRDNEQMLSQLDLIYSALAIQIRAGVYITDALAECCNSVAHPRLYDGLQSLAGAIVMKADMDDALEQFQNRFHNRYIDTLCITILQALESGQAVELLGDISQQIKDMDLLVQNKRREQLNRSTTFYQLGIFVLVLGLTLYTCTTHLFDASLFGG